MKKLFLSDFDPILTDFGPKRRQEGRMSLKRKESIIITGKNHVPRVIFPWTDKNGLLGRPLPPLGLITALASLGAVKTALGRQGPPSKTIFPVHEKISLGT